MDEISLQNLSINTTSVSMDISNKVDMKLPKYERKFKKPVPRITHNVTPETLEELRVKNTASFQCLAQISLSRSSILMHNLYNFPSMIDPGVNESLDYENYDDTADVKSTAIYTSRCHDLKIGVIKRVLNSLTTSKLDLRYFGLSVQQIKAITAALTLNRHVKELILEENYLTAEGVFHISEMLRDNNCIEYVNLSGCNIKAGACAELVDGIATTQSVRELDLSKNNMGSVGLVKFLTSIRDNCSINKLDLSHNLLNQDVAEGLGLALGESETIQDLNISWNNFNTTKAIYFIFKGLYKADMVKILNFSWNHIRDADVFHPIQRYLFKTKTLQHLDLSNNQMYGSVIKLVKQSILGNSSLISINLGSNWISPDEAYDIAQVFVTKTKRPLKLKYLDLENIVVNHNFVPFWQMVTSMGKRIRIDHVLGNYEIAGPNVIKILFDRLRYITNKHKSSKSKREFGHFLYNLGADFISKYEFLKAINKSRLPKLKKQQDLLKEIIKIYVIKIDKLDIKRMKEDYYNLYPDTTIPPPKKTKVKTDRTKKPNMVHHIKSNLQWKPSNEELIVIKEVQAEN